MKTPPHAKKVFSGVIFDVYQWPQETFDGSVHTWEMIKRTPAVNIFTVHDGKILVLEQEQPLRPLYHSVPGGCIDSGETPEAAARRELLEETGYQAQTLSLIREYDGDNKMDFADYVFLSHDCEKVAQPHLDSGEKISARWIDFEEFLNLVRDDTFAIPYKFRTELWEALLDPNKKTELKRELGL